MGFPRPEYWTGFPFPSAGDLPDSGIKLASSESPGLQAASSPASHREAQLYNRSVICFPVKSNLSFFLIQWRGDCSPTKRELTLWGFLSSCLFRRCAQLRYTSLLSSRFSPWDLKHHQFFGECQVCQWILLSGGSCSLMVSVLFCFRVRWLEDLFPAKNST